MNSIQFTEDQRELLLESIKQFKTSLRRTVGHYIALRDDTQRNDTTRRDAGMQVLKLGKKLLSIYRLERKVKITSE